MEFEKEIKELLQKFSQQFGPVIIIEADVLSINEDDTMVVELPGKIVIDDVRLKSVIKDGSFFKITPEIGSTVCIGRIGSSEEWILISTGNIQNMMVAFDSLIFRLREDGLYLKKGNDNIKEVFENIIESVMQIVVMNGNNPNYDKLQTALEKTQNLFSDANE